MYFSCPHSCNITLPISFSLNLSFYLWLVEEWKLRNTPFCEFPQPPTNAPHFGKSILLSTLSSNMLSLCSSLNDRDQVTLSCKTTAKLQFCVFYLLCFQRANEEAKVQALPEFNLLLISSWIRFWFVTVVPKYLNCATFLKHLSAIFMSWFCPPFWWRDSNIYLVFSVFTSDQLPY
jgi:hypothetical protein